MPIYKYKAIKQGKEYQGERELPDKSSLYKDIKAEGGFIISAEENKTSDKNRFSFSFFKGVSQSEKISFAKNLAVMIEAGISINRALSIMAKQVKNKKLFNILESLQESIDKGKSLSEAMGDYKNVFSDLFVMMVKSGEESGKMVDSLRIVAGQLERSNQLSKKIRGAMIYPVIVMCIMLILGTILLIFMVPTLTETFKGLNVPLPLPTQVIIFISDFLRAYILFIIAGVIALGIGISYALKTPRGKHIADFITLHLPLITPIAKEVNAARTARTMSSLISSGVDIVIAIGVTRDVLQNSYYKKVLNEAADSIQKGGTISSVFAKAGDLYPVFVSEMAAVGEETGKLSDMLENIAEFYEEEVDQKTKDLSTIIEPLLMVIIGAAVGVFAVAMLAPTYSLVDVIGK